MTTSAVVLQPGDTVSVSAAVTPAPAPIPTPPKTLQQLVDGAAAGSVLDLTGLVFSAGATIPKALTIRGGVITVTAGNALSVNAAGVTLDGIALHGQGSAFAGVWAEAASGILVTNCTATDFAYAGIMLLSTVGGTVHECTVARIGYTLTPSSPNDNAYGICASQYAGQPLSTDISFDGNTVTDIPTWHAFDTHGGQRIKFTNNVVQRCSRGIFVTTDGGTRKATQIVVSGNQLLSPSPVAFNLQAITLYNVDGIEFDHNTISGWGGTSTVPYYDYGAGSTGIVVGAGNEVIP
ncbi:MAG: right-handed parallel beta-helix repeat-containing protein [Candidatus Limnocylindrales bacterium]